MSNNIYDEIRKKLETLDNICITNKNNPHITDIVKFTKKQRDERKRQIIDYELNKALGLKN